MIQRLALALFLISILTGELAATIISADHSSYTVSDLNKEKESEHDSKEGKEGKEDCETESKFHSSSLNILAVYNDPWINHRHDLIFSHSTPHLESVTPPPENN